MVAVATMMFSGTSLGCDIEDYSWNYNSVFNYHELHVRTTCKQGIISLSFYDKSGKYLGNAEALVQGFTSTIPIVDISADDISTYKYSIESY